MTCNCIFISNCLKFFSELLLFALFFFLSKIMQFESSITIFELYELLVIFSLSLLSKAMILLLNINRLLINYA